MNFWIGTSGFQYPEWKGSFYPEKISAPKMLPYYAARFNSTESNYTFRSTPSAKTIANWLAATPEHFRFSLKAPQNITHFARLHDAGGLVTEFWQAVAGLETKLGPVLFQLPPNFKKDAPLLRAFLESLPSGLRAAFEFRHASWFDEEVYAHLRQRGAALCLAENEELAVPRVATAKFGYLRLRCENYTKAHLDSWVRFLREPGSTWGDAFIYFMHEETGRGPKFAQQLAKLLHA